MSGQIEISGIIYDILRCNHERTTQHGTRREFELKRPRGKKLYHATLFENGVWSEVI